MNDLRRLRAARTLFDRAQRDNVTIQEARRRIHAERYAAVADKLGRTGAIGLCGTAAPPVVETVERCDRRPFWWQAHD